MVLAMRVMVLESCFKLIDSRRIHEDRHCLPGDRVYRCRRVSGVVHSGVVMPIRDLNLSEEFHLTDGAGMHSDLAG